MEAGRTELRGTSREGRTANRGSGWIGKLRSTATQQAQRTTRLITAIIVIVALSVLAAPAAADTLVSNLTQGAKPPTDKYKLSVNDFAMPFTTGTNATGYQLESISIDFVVGRARQHDPVYVYVHEDNGNGRPNHNNGGQVATLTKNGTNFEGPVTGVNKYTVWEKNGCCPKAAAVQLDANTRYWVYIWAGENATTAQLAQTASDSENGAAGWGLASAVLIKPQGTAYSSWSYIPDVIKLKVEGRIQGLSRLAIRARTTATEGVDDAAEFEVGLSRASPITVTVDYATEDQTAFAPADFEATSGTLTFQPGDTVKKVLVPIVDDDDLAESDEEFNLKLSNAVAATIRVTTGVATIVNNTTAKISISDATATEGVDATMDFVVSLNGAAASTITVRASTSQSYDATEGTDYAYKGQTLTFNPGETEKVFSVQIVDDTVDDDGERFEVFLSNPTGDAVIADNRGIGTIRNHEDLTASFHNVPQNHDGNTAFTFNAQFNNDVGIGYADMRDHAFTVTEGDVTGARRNNGQSDSWEITVEPDGNDPVTVTLPGHRACTTRGAICSKEENPVQLTNSPSATIAGPPEVEATTPTMSIAGGSGKEGDDDDIDFTVTLDEAASGTVTVDYTTSDGTADAGDDYTAKSGTLSFSAGTTSKTLSVGIEDDIENESDETFTVTLSNPSGADLGTATATGTIQNRKVEPLTARFEGMPSEHDGSEFTFELHFSENVKTGFAKMRDRAFTLDEADIVTVKRKNPQSADKNKTWTITVKPDGNDRISITLPAAASCTDNKSICTHDDRKLSHSTSATVDGPVGISVGDVEVTEGADAVLVFAVSLTRAAGSALTVDYATSDGTATAGSDYTSASGTLTIGAGSSSGSIEVSVIDDEHNEGSETFTLTLSNPSSGNLTDSSATGTITNHDALPAALVARFGRTAALHVVEQVEERVNAPRAPGFDGRVAGRQIGRDMGRDFALDFVRQLGGGAGYAPGAGGGFGPVNGAGAHHAQATNSTMTSSLGPQNMAGQAMNAGRMQGMHPADAYEGHLGMGLGSDQLMSGSSFALNRQMSSGGVLSFWSRSASSAFYGQDGALALNGDVRSTMFGADYSRGRMITGVSLSHTRGLGNYAGVDSGRMTSAVTGLYPWVGYKASERVTVWTVGGYGAGGLMLNPGAGAPIETGLSMAMAAGGGRGEIIGDGDGFALAVKADALWVGTRTKAVNGPGGKLKASNAAVSRLRTAIEGSQKMTIGRRIALSPSVELGIRQDGGDAETGAGMDLGAGLVFADGGSRLAVDLRIRRLLMHQAEGFAESGFSISVSYDPRPSTALGFNARVAPSWGTDTMSGAEGLWGRETMGGMGHDHLMGSGNRLDAEAGYGLALGTRLVGTPRVGMRASQYGRDYRVGYAVSALEQGAVSLQLGIDAERRESPMLYGFGQGPERSGADQRVIGSASLGW